MVAVVVVDDDAGGFALALEPATDAGERAEAVARMSSLPACRAPEAAPATPSALAALCRPAVGRRTRRGPPAPSRPCDSTVVPSGSLATIRPTTAGAAPGPLRTASRCPACAGRPPSGTVEEPRGDDPAVAVASRCATAPARVADVRRRACAPLGRAGTSQATNASTHRVPVGEDVGVVPLARCQDRDVRPVRVEVAGVLVRLHDEGPSPRPSAPSPEGRP